jgi:hypothetical protein
MRVSYLLFVCLVLGCPVISQQNPSAPQKGNPPTLPVIDQDACPFEGCTFGEWTLRKQTPLYTTWKADRVQIGNLIKGQKVNGLTGVHVTRKPDTIQTQVDIPELSLKKGETFFRYMYRGEGAADIWVKGKWMKEKDCTFVTEKDGGGCLRDCPAIVIENGDKEWWVRIQTKSGKVGWAKVEDNIDGMDSLG